MRGWDLEGEGKGGGEGVGEGWSPVAGVLVDVCSGSGRRGRRWWGLIYGHVMGELEPCSIVSEW